MIALVGERGAAVATALARMEGNADFETVKAWLNDSLRIQEREMKHVRNGAIEIAQGYAEALEDLAGPFNSPRAVLDALRTADRVGEQARLIRAGLRDE